MLTSAKCLEVNGVYANWIQNLMAFLFTGFIIHLPILICLMSTFLPVYLCTGQWTCGVVEAVPALIRHHSTDNTSWPFLRVPRSVYFALKISLTIAALSSEDTDLLCLSSETDLPLSGPS